jgi:hypothetical protein
MISSGTASSGGRTSRSMTSFNNDHDHIDENQDDG